MEKIYAKAVEAQEAYNVVEDLQSYFVTRLNELSTTYGENKVFSPVEWFRDEGCHGGGIRYVANDDALFNRASVNISQVQYDDNPSKSLASATALSTIIHPKNPHAPSIHMHISWTQLKDGEGYWRIMADLNPAIVYDEDTIAFETTLEKKAKEHYDEGHDQGERYFYIPVLERHRGVSHFYLEGFNSGDFESDKQFAVSIGESVIQTYIKIVENALSTRTEISTDDIDQQLAYHSVYLLQVLTLDRGTTSGLLIHDQNDVGIMGSIPRYVDKDLLRVWISKMPAPQDALLKAIVDGITTNDALINDEVKANLAAIVRGHYQKNPQALSMQASCDIVPATVDNHK